MCVGNIKNKNINNSLSAEQIPKKMEQSQLESVELNNEININRDLLSKLTNYTKKAIHQINLISDKVQSSYCYKLIPKTTQPAHLITLVSALLLAKILSPTENADEISLPQSFLKLVYLGSFASHFGIQIWMTFVSGIALYLNLPRHTFGSVQKVLFPKYFLVNAVLSLITLCSFLKYQDDAGQDRLVLQNSVLVTCFCIELVIRLYMTPRLLHLMTEKILMETAAGVGMEVGRHNPGALVECPTYMQLHSSFRKVHMTIAIGNMITMACTAVHLHYLSDKICII